MDKVNLERISKQFYCIEIQVINKLSEIILIHTFLVHVISEVCWNLEFPTTFSSFHCFLAQTTISKGAL